MGEIRRPTYRDAKTGTRRVSRVWWIRYYRNGVRYEESSGSTRRADAERLLRLREGDLARGLPVSPGVGRLLFEEAVADVLNDYRVNRKRSLEHVERRIRKHLLPFFGGRRMATITTADARAFVAARQAAGASNAEINRELAILRRTFRLALQAGKLLHMPHIPVLRENNVRRGFFERAEFEALRAHLPAPLRGVVTFAYLTGWRVPSEVLPLEWRQVSRATHTIRLDPGQTKNAEGRVFPYGALRELVDVIEGQWQEHERLRAAGVLAPHVFTWPDGRPICSLYGAWRKACAAAGLHGRIPHDFRRTAIRNLVRAGVPERVAMQLTGHKKRSVFDRYDIVNEADLRAAVARLTTAAGDASERHGIVRPLPQGKKRERARRRVASPASAERL